MSRLLDSISKFFDVDGVDKKAAAGYFDRRPLSDFILPAVFNPDLPCYVCRDNTIGFVFECYPKPLAGEETVKILQALYASIYLPDNTTIQVTLWASDFLEPFNAGFRHLRKSEELDEQSSLWLDLNSDFMMSQKRHGSRDEVPVPLRDFRLYFSFKIPIPFSDLETKYRDIEIIYRNIKTSLETAYLSPYPMPPEHLIRTLYLMYNPNHDRSIMPDYDPDDYIYKQILQADTSMEVGKDHIQYDGVFGKALTVKQFPEQYSIFDTLFFVGDMAKDELQVTCPFMLTLNLIKVGENLRRKQEARADFLYRQRLASAFSVKLSKKKDEAAWMIEKIVDGNTLMNGFITWWLYHDDYNVVHKNAQMLKNLLDLKGFKLQEELRSVNLALFLYGVMPLSLNPEVDQILLKRSRPMFDFNAAHLSPIQADWKGTGSLVAPFKSRRGQNVFINLFDGSEGFNGIVAAETGSGKSVVTAKLITAYFSLPFVSNIWVIDVGESYKGICQFLGGVYLDFREEENFVINPFSECEDLEEDIGLFIDLVARMAKTKDDVTDTERNVIEEAIRHSFGQYSTKTNVDTIIESLSYIVDTSDSVKQSAAKLIAANLYRFGSAGTYGRYFNGTNNIDMQHKFVVFEMKNIEHKPDLMNVLLMVLFYHISHVIYREDDRSKRKLLIFDESWRFFTDEKVAHFIMKAYKTARKHGAAAITINQSIDEFYLNRYTKEMLFQASYWFLLKQKPESINLLKREEKVALSEYEFDLLHNIRTLKGRYSEIFMKTPLGRGIVRLELTRPEYWIYTTDPTDVGRRNEMVERYGFQDGILKCIEIYDNAGH